MAKGNICISCEKVVKEHWDTGKTINGMPRIYCVDCMKCRDCQRKFKEDEEIVITSGDKYLQCEECGKKHKHEQKCDDCKVKVATCIILGGGKGKVSLCNECKEKRNEMPNGKDSDICDKCKKNPQSNKSGTKDWNFCVECLQYLQEQKNRPSSSSGRSWCPECQKILSWGRDYKDGGRDERHEEWLKKTDKHNNSCPSNCQINHSLPCCGEACYNVWKQKYPPTDNSKEPPRDDKNKPNDKGKEPRPNELCERCGASCIVSETKTSYTIKRRRYIEHRTDFTRKYSQWFGLNCGCIEKYKQENQQTCPQCKKHEFPDMKEGWMLDYGIKKAFCSAKCHVTYRELEWEEASRLRDIEMMPPELDIEANPNQNTDWEKEGLKREVLYWRDYAKSLEQQLNNPNLTPEERQQANYLRNLQQNTLRNAEQAYHSRYGSLTEDGSNKGGMSVRIIFLIIIGVVALTGGIIFLLTRNKKDKKL